MQEVKKEEEEALGFGEEKPRRLQTLGEEIGNAVTHGVGALFGIVALILMLIKSDSSMDYLGSILFGASMIILYTMSCLYHSFKNGSRVKRIFKRFDHLSIYLLIAGTFAPILVSLINTSASWIFFYIQWAIVIVGVVFKSIWPKKFVPLHLVLYLLLGWSALFFLKDLVDGHWQLFLFILLGGLSYSGGVIFYRFANFKYQHFVWHFFVMFGSVLQFIGIYLYVL